MGPEEFKHKFASLFEDVLRMMKSEEVVVAEKNNEKLRLRIYTSKSSSIPLEKVTVMSLENGWVKNIKNKSIVDECEFIVAAFRPSSNIPLPVFAMEASFHCGKYDHLNADLFLLSKDPAYRAVFCEPVMKLRKKHDGLEGLLSGVRNPMLGDYTSGGMMAGDFSESSRSITLPWVLDYCALYREFVRSFESIPVLKEKAIIEEGKQVGEMFRSMFKKATPRILSDIPNLCSEEAGNKLGKLLF
ncbi:MAG: hypothetical protein HZA77_04840 [Candidatus Schekmanbacteria bacterium]|nr:hypothetical protein [Candidatus Schekmanbacteria bacterium]